MSRDIHLVNVFAARPGGGNPAPVVIDATGCSEADMRAVAKTYGHESVFVSPPPADASCDFIFRFFVPNHEMEMCGHATVGAVWLLDRLGRLPRDQVRITTLIGIVQAHVAQAGTPQAQVEISQPKATSKLCRTPIHPLPPYSPFLASMPDRWRHCRCTMAAPAG